MEEKDKEIHLMELINKLLNNKFFIIKFVVIATIIGVIIAFSIPKKYTSSVVFTTETNSATANMGALASLAGINLSGTQGKESLSPELYSDIIMSTPFMQQTLYINVKDLDQKIDTTLYSYLKNDQNKAWWSYIFQLPGMLLHLFKSDNTVSGLETQSQYYVSNEEMRVINTLRNACDLSIDKKTKVTTLSITTQSPVISAFLSDTLTSYLQSYIIGERTKKAKNDLENSKRLYDKSKKEYFEAQRNLAAFIDGNQNLISARYRLNQDKLQNEVSLAYSLYNQMAQQVQMNSIRVQDNTPVFSIIQPSIESLDPSTPSASKIIFVLVFLSLIATSIWILREDLLRYFKD